jgi:hypothetical protein
MTIQEFKEYVKHVPSKSELIFFSDGSVTDDEGTVLLPGLGYMDADTKEFVYLGEIIIIDESEENT